MQRRIKRKEAGVDGGLEEDQVILDLLDSEVKTRGSEFLATEFKES